jgi:hypothetical protein
MSLWKRWLGYAKTRIDLAVRAGNRQLDRREAELDARRAERPWSSDAEVPTFEEAQAHIEHRTAGAGSAPRSSGDPTFDLAEQQRAASERLAEIRRAAGLDPDPTAGSGG